MATERLTSESFDPRLQIGCTSEAARIRSSNGAGDLPAIYLWRLTSTATGRRSLLSTGLRLDNGSGLAAYSKAALISDFRVIYPSSAISTVIAKTIPRFSGPRRVLG